MRQIMPHRNNIAVHRTKCKCFFREGPPGRAGRAEKGRIHSEQMRNRDVFASFMIIRNNAL
ncbi:MAG: hypothetical protein ABR970_04845 [Roseiarcus sp.]|jgi:hypothetical protein